MLPIEFCVTGTPISHQSHNKELLRNWGKHVEAAALAVVPRGTDPVTAPVRLHVVYYFEQGGARIPDEDNLLKPIQDALRGIIYQDDDQVMDGICRKRDIDGRFVVRRWSLVLAEAFVRGDEFVHVTVTQAPDPGALQS